MGSDLLDTNAWSSFVTTEMDNAGGMAIGAPTAEMWVASWNANDGYPQLYMAYAQDIAGDPTHRDGLRTGFVWKSEFPYPDYENGMPYIRNTDNGYDNPLYRGENGSNYLISSILTFDDERRTIGGFSLSLEQRYYDDRDS